MKGIVNRERCLSHIRDEELKSTLTRLLDRWERAYRSKKQEITGFYDPYTREMGEGILIGLPDMGYAAFGGYPEAERKRLVLFPEGNNIKEEDFHLAYLQVEGNFKFRSANHRDYLGSLLNLGIEREKIGDIIVGDQGCQVVLDRDLAPFVILNWKQVHQVTVKVTEIAREDLVMPRAEKKEIKSTVASPRLDAILGIGFGLSRTKTLPDIKGGKVQVNWKTVTEPSYRINAGDRISYRGKGRISVEDFSGPTQKGRYFVRIFRYL